jgi:uncharacterized Zn-finger protein
VLLDSERQLLTPVTKHQQDAKVYSQPGYLNQHAPAHDGVKSYTCELCGTIFAGTRNAKSYRVAHRGNLKFHMCVLCIGKFSKANNPKRYKRIHTGEKPYKCGVCSKSFSQSNALVAHKRIHSGEKPYTCELCSKKFSLAGQLKRHEQIHTGEKPYKCDVCSKSFAHSSTLVAHKRIHTGEKPYKCGVCRKSFSHSNTLVEHKRIHTGEKPCKCDVCSKSFSHYSTLVAHKRIHTAAKPYTCELCGKKFSQVGNLKRHKRVHSDKKPYIYDRCIESSSQPSTLAVRKQIHTGEPPCDRQQCDKNLLGCIRIRDQSNASVSSTGKFQEDIELLTKSPTRNDEKPYECYDSVNLHSEGDRIKTELNEQFMRRENLTGHECCAREELPSVFQSSCKMLDFCKLLTDIKKESEQDENTSMDSGSDRKNSVIRSVQINERICPVFVKEENVLLSFAELREGCKTETDWKLTVMPYVKLYRIDIQVV